jgi:hypothetical protein
MPRSTTFAVTERHPLRRRLFAVALGVALIVELGTAAALLAWSATDPGYAHQLRLVDRGGPAALSERISREMPAAIDAVSAFWGDDWPREIVVVTTGTDREFAANTGMPDRNWSGVAAVSVADGVDLDRRKAFGQRIVFAAGADSMSDQSLRIVLRHELFHYASRAQTAFDAPRWLTEGVADYVARPADARPRGPAPPAELPSDAELDAKGAAGSTAYDRAWWFAAFVADTYGPRALRRLYAETCRPGHPDPDSAARAALGTSLPDVLSGWRRWLAK